MGFRVVNESSFTFKTDLPPSLRDIHPSGVLHAFRLTLPETNTSISNGGSHIGREEHTFAWIADAVHIESALSLLEERGFDREAGIVFIPYSSQRNWLDRYPHAEPALECTDSGRCVVYMDWRPYPNGLGALGEAEDGGASLRADDIPSTRDGDGRDDDGSAAPAAVAPSEKRRHKSGAMNILRDNSYIPDAERDELHIEIYNYLSWLHAKLVEVERNGELEKARKSDATGGKNRPASTRVPPDSDVEISSVPRRDGNNGRRLCKVVGCPKQSLFSKGDGFCKRHFNTFAVAVEGDDIPLSAESDANKDEVDDEDEKKEADDHAKEDDNDDEKKEAETLPPKNKNGIKRYGIDLSELRGVLDKLELTFFVIPNAKSEAATEETQQQRQREGEEHLPQREGGEAELRQPQEKGKEQISRKGAPFLEEALSDELRRLVAAREAEGKRKRRSRKRPRRRLASADDGERRRGREPNDFDEVFRKLVRYKEEHGDTVVQKHYEDQQLANWVRKLRGRKAELVKRGMEVEEVPPGEPVRSQALTAERVEKLNSIGFVWSVDGPRTAWEDRFRELMEYYEANGSWPSQLMGSLGHWVAKQRAAYNRKDAKYMKDRAPRLDEVGFEWTPRGYTRMSWEEGFELLMEFGRMNGHYDVPQPSNPSGKVDRKSEEFRLYKWVQSLHGMYRSYRLGRQSGSLTDERVVLLIKHGFVFHED